MMVSQPPPRPPLPAPLHIPAARLQSTAAEPAPAPALLAASLPAHPDDLVHRRPCLAVGFAQHVPQRPGQHPIELLDELGTLLAPAGMCAGWGRAAPPSGQDVGGWRTPGRTRDRQVGRKAGGERKKGRKWAGGWLGAPLPPAGRSAGRWGRAAGSGLVAAEGGTAHSSPAATPPAADAHEQQQQHPRCLDDVVR